MPIVDGDYDQVCDAGWISIRGDSDENIDNVFSCRATGDHAVIDLPSVARNERTSSVLLCMADH